MTLPPRDNPKGLADEPVDGVGSLSLLRTSHVSFGSVVYTLCSDWMIPCKRSPLISPLRMTQVRPIATPSASLDFS
ncbi:hypothetical protein DAPPUDRAFT_264504 [Daphnia pulex]|uniref:Uncharacterized protein n=1 Tax=Daphnia pulex TaxID=6669 RepID=E9HRQ4_DAPPU|nr:hypothetical protein DAPPUDRAFT_264504 [Daphnia pulex]|eukprot:EFX65546.1 hypothetical protein DAPPUDRAFT_264504 [Daphnia pulex]